MGTSALPVPWTYGSLGIAVYPEKAKNFQPAAYYPSGDLVRGVAFCEPGDPGSPQARNTSGVEAAALPIPKNSAQQSGLAASTRQSGGVGKMRAMPGPR